MRPRVKSQVWNKTGVHATYRSYASFNSRCRRCCASVNSVWLTKREETLLLPLLFGWMGASILSGAEDDELNALVGRVGGVVRLAPSPSIDRSRSTVDPEQKLNDPGSGGLGRAEYNTGTAGSLWDTPRG